MNRCIYLYTLRGNLSEESHNLIKRLKKKLPPGPEPVRLYAENIDVEIWNLLRLSWIYSLKLMTSVKGRQSKKELGVAVSNAIMASEKMS